MAKRLSRTARAQLQSMLRFRDRPMTLWALIVAHRRSYAIFFAYLTTFAAVLACAIEPAVWILVVSAALVAVLRDLGYFIRAERAWPVTRSVIDWQLVEQLLDADDSAVTGRSASENFEGEGCDKSQS